ncbi:MAG TPA: PIG-L family deacetylase [Cytophagales bacterium]|nr:PIG-L family deacetylase [Cytophagales bacterium]
MHRIRISLFFLFTLSLFSLKAQPIQTLTSSEIELALKKLNTVGSVLYIAAHPDDENTSLLAYFANEKLLKTSYLSLTRGDGGQNLIGKEIREQLGVIRTQELLAARRIDGADQYFSRANDFGYSKNPEEALKIWGKDQILSDVVWTIRKTRPDIIVTRFPSTGEGGHGHHTASAILAEEAFNAAADPKKFPEQLKWVSTWQPKTLYWNAWRQEKGLPVDIGTYNPLLGKSYTEIAAESRTMHKSQGFGVPKTRASKNDYLAYIIGEKPDNALFENIDLSWKRVKGAEEFSRLITQAIQNFKSTDPSASLPLLIKANKALQNIEDEFWKKEKSKELLKVILSCAGFYYETTASSFQTFPGGTLDLTMLILNRSSYPITLKKILYQQGKEDTLVSKSLLNGQELTIKSRFDVSQSKEYSEKYWLKNPYSEGLYTVQNQELIGTPDNKAPFATQFEIEIDGQVFKLESPIMYKWTDPVEGEKYRTVEVLPLVTAKMDDKVYIFPNAQGKTIQVALNAQTDTKGELSLEVPQGWNVTPKTVPFEFRGNNNINFTFQLIPDEKAASGEVKALVKIGNKTTSKSRVVIDYEHIPVQVLLPDASARLVKVDLAIAGKNIGYIEGAGDDIPSILKQSGYTITTLTDEQLSSIAELAKFDAIIVGIRGYNTNESLKTNHHNLMAYVHQGGKLVVQYNTSHRLLVDNPAPYPLELSRDRITNENSPVKILNADHQLLNFPNKITLKDFEGWVQERGLYFPGKWDKNYVPLISSHDPDEKALEGGILVAEYGKGSYIYTSYSWFRQLPQGVPGAIRIFGNLISHNKEIKSAATEKF